MLNIAIIYIPGSGGSFLRRALSLSNNSIVALADKSINVEEKFVMFNNWSSQDWKSAEFMHLPAYKTGQQEFVEFEKSELTLVDAWHPSEFLKHDTTEICWPQSSWPTMVFLHVDPGQSRFFLENQKTKAYSLDWDNELADFNTLRSQYKDRAIDITFDELCNETKFIDWIKQINQKLQLNLELPLVNMLWNNWYSKSKLVWIQ